MSSSEEERQAYRDSKAMAMSRAQIKRELTQTINQLANEGGRKNSWLNDLEEKKSRRSILAPFARANVNFQQELEEDDDEEELTHSLKTSASAAKIAPLPGDYESPLAPNLKAGKRRKSYIVKTNQASMKMKKKMHMTLNSNVVQGSLFFATVLALYGSDVAVAFLPRDWYEGIGWVTMGIFIIFLFELVVQCIVNHAGYRWSFYFFLDVIGTFSLVPDIPIIWEIFFPQGAVDLSYLRAGRIVRTGTRTTRALRLLRFIRFARVMRMFRLIRFFRRIFNQQLAADQDSEERRSPSKLGLHLADLLGKRVIIGTIVLLLVMPHLEVPVIDYSLIHGLHTLEKSANRTIDSLDNVTLTEYLDEVESLREGFHTTSPVVETVNNALDTSEEFQFLMHEYVSNQPHLVEFSVLKRIYMEAPPEFDTRGWAVSLQIWQTGSRASYVANDNRETEQVQAIYNIALTTTLIVLMGTSAYFFNSDVHEIVVKPLVKVTQVIRKLARTLFLLSKDDQDETTETTTMLEGNFVDTIVSQLNTFFAVDTTKKKSLWRSGKRRKPFVRASELKSEKEVDNDDSIDNSPKGGDLGVKDLAISPRKLISAKRVKCLASLEELWKDSQGLQFFKVFLTQEFAVESLLFIQAIDGFKESYSDVERQVKDIILKFVHERAETQVNISARERDNLINAAKKEAYSLNTFNRAREEIFQQLQRDNFARFKRSDLAKELVEVKKTKLKEYTMMKQAGEPSAPPSPSTSPRVLEIVHAFATKLKALGAKTPRIRSQGFGGNHEKTKNEHEKSNEETKPID